MYLMVMMFFPIIGLINSVTGFLSFCTPSYYYRYKWNWFYPVFVIINIVYCLGSALGALIYFLAIYQAKFSKSALF